MGHQCGFAIASSCLTVERYYGAPTRIQHCPPSLHGGAVRGTNAASTSPAVIARWSGTGCQCGFVIASCHRTVELYYRAPTLL